MANVPSLRWSVLDVLSSARELAKTVDQQKVLQEQGKYFYKLSLSEIVTLMNKSLDPTYFTSQVVTETDEELYYDFLDTESIDILDDTTKIIHRSDGLLFTIGSLLYIVLIQISDGAILYQGVIRLTSSGASASYSLIAGSLTTYDDDTMTISVLLRKSSISSGIIDISAINYDRIISLEDSDYGECIYVTPQEFASLGRDEFSHTSYRGDIVWTLMGNTIRIKNGSQTTGGTKTLWYQRQPNYPSDWAVDMVDLPDKHIPLLIKRIYTWMILQSENDVPKNLAQEMQLDYSMINAVTQTETENKDKTNKGQSGQKVQ